MQHSTSIFHHFHGIWKSILDIYYNVAFEHYANSAGAHVLSKLQLVLLYLVGLMCNFIFLTSASFAAEMT